MNETALKIWNDCVEASNTYRCLVMPSDILKFLVIGAVSGLKHYDKDTANQLLDELGEHFRTDFRGFKMNNGLG